MFNLTKNIVKRNLKSHVNAIKNYNDSSNFIKFGNKWDVLRLSGNCLTDKNSKVDTCGCEANYDCDNLNLFDSIGYITFQVENFEVFEIL